MRVRGLKLELIGEALDWGRSHPVRVRGLKHPMPVPENLGTNRSHPVRVRGLKHPTI